MRLSVRLLSRGAGPSIHPFKCTGWLSTQPLSSEGPSVESHAWSRLKDKKQWMEPLRTTRSSLFHGGPPDRSPGWRLAFPSREGAELGMRREESWVLAKSEGGGKETEGWESANPLMGRVFVVDCVYRKCTAAFFLTLVGSGALHNVCVLLDAVFYLPLNLSTSVWFSDIMKNSKCPPLFVLKYSVHSIKVPLYSGLHHWGTRKRKSGDRKISQGNLWWLALSRCCRKSRSPVWILRFYSLGNFVHNTWTNRLLACSKVSQQFVNSHEI